MHHPPFPLLPPDIRSLICFCDPCSHNFDSLHALCFLWYVFLRNETGNLPAATLENYVPYLHTTRSRSFIYPEAGRDNSKKSTTAGFEPAPSKRNRWNAFIRICRVNHSAMSSQHALCMDIGYQRGYMVTPHSKSLIQTHNSIIRAWELHY